jgi:hypothetical protein
MATPMPALAAPRNAPTIEMVRSVSGGFDIDAYHCMDQRDNELVADEVLHGAGSDTFVYHFTINGTDVAGVSVVGARHLANHYRGLKHRIVGYVQKTGALFEYRAMPHETFAGDTRVQVIAELAGEPDYYSCVVEITDIKTGNSIMVESREERIGYSRNNDPYEKPNYQKIAQSKAYRNAVLALLPQDVVIRWKAEMLKLKKGETITASVISEKRRNVLQFAARHAIAFDRRRIEALTLDQIAGLGDAARDGALPAFVNAARALGLEVGQGEKLPEPATETAPPPQRGRGRGRPPKASAADDDSGGGIRPPEPPPPASADPQGDPPQRVRFE